MPSDPLKLTEVDDLVREDHSHLRAEDQCLFLREYTARVGYAFSETNRLVLNLKKAMSRRANKEEWKWKERAIRQFAAELVQALHGKWKVAGQLIVPVPPSRTRGHAEYDDRMVRVAKLVGAKLGVDVVELLEALKDRVAQHVTEEKRSILQHTKNLRVRADLVSAPPKGIILLDDVLVTGCTFVACKSVLLAAFPKVPVCGIYIARRRILEVAGDDDGDPF